MIEQRTEPPVRLPRAEVGALVGTFRLVRLLGRGGMASVFEAVHTALGTRCAIKVLDPARTTDGELVRRFFNEGRAIVHVGHPNVVEVYDVGTTPEGLCYLRMELLRGRPLQRLLREEGRLAIERAARLAGQVARALAAAHAAGVVHRDLKPENVFLVERDGVEQVKVLDFGIAKLLGAGTGDRTDVGVVLGTERYMSPEQRRGAHDVDHRTDIFALGLLLHLLIAGELPFDDDDDRPPGKVAPRPLRAVATEAPAELEAVILRALDPDPRLRFQRMDDLGDSLVPFGAAPRGPAEPPRGVGSVDGEEITALISIGPASTAGGGQEITRPGLRRDPVHLFSRRWLWASIAAAALAALVAVQRSYRRAPAPQPPAQASTPATPPAPEMVRVTVSSRPSGARVLLDDGAFAGLTPLQIAVRRSPAPLRVRIEREGYTPYEQTFALEENRAIDAVLAPVRAPRTRRRASGDLLAPHW